MMARQALRWVGLALAFLLLFVVSVAGFWFLRPNRSEVDDALGAEVWPVVRDGFHNSNTHLIYWHDAFYLVHARSRFHMGNDESRLSQLQDGRWKVVSGYFK